MRLTQALRQQHIGQWFKSLWYHRRNIAVQDMKADAALAEKGVAIEDAFKLLYPELPHFIKYVEFVCFFDGHQIKTSLRYVHLTESKLSNRHYCHRQRYAKLLAKRIRCGIRKNVTFSATQMF